MVTAQHFPRLAPTMSYSSDSKEEAIGSIGPVVPADFAGDNGDYRFTPEQVAAYEIDPDVHKRVVRAYDKRILPTILIMYLFSALDRGNVSNAKSDHMDLDLGFKGNEWNTMLTVFYVPFCLMAYPGTFMSKKFGAHRTMPIYMAGWGVMALFCAAVKNYHQTLVVRLILGMFEGCFGASLNMYLACFYKRDELGKRMATWYSTVAISGAFSGLLSYGLFQVKSRIHGWQLLFLVEGGMTVLFAIVAWFALPPLPTKSTFLTPHERTVAVMRLLKDSTTEVDAEFNLKAYFEPAKEWQTWAWAFYCLIYGVANQTASVFLTQIIGRFGFSKVKTNLYTVPPYACAVVVLWCVVISSDYHRERTCHTMFANLLVVIGTITLACVPVNHIAPGYFCTFLITSGSFIPSVLFLSFVQNNTTKENSRAFRAAVMNFGANAGGIVSSNIFLQQFAPKYVTPLIVSAAIAALGICVLICLRTYMVLDNRRRNREQGVTWTSKDVPTAALSNGPSDPQYRWFY